MSDLIEELTYAEARPHLMQVNPRLCEEIDRLGVTNHYKLLKMTYRYGDTILKNGTFYIPNGSAQGISKNSPDCPEWIRKHLNYDRVVPMFMPLTGAIELLFSHPQRPAPFLIANPGHVLGLAALIEPQERMDPPIFWQAFAGARSTWLLPKVSHSTWHNRLCREYTISAECPRTIYDHHHIFAAIANADAFAQQRWTSEVLVFTAPWFKDRTSDPWRIFREYLLKLIWAGNTYRLASDMYSLLIGDMIKKFKPSPDLFSAVEYAIYLALGKKLGHHIAMDDSLLPLSQIQQAYLDGYLLQEYTPEIIVPAYATPTALYSMTHENHADMTHAHNNFLPKYQRLIKTIDMLRCIQSRLRSWDGEPLGIIEKIKDCQFQGIYFEAHPKDGIISVDEFAKRYPSKDRHRRFPRNASYFGGCIEISASPQGSKR